MAQIGPQSTGSHAGLRQESEAWLETYHDEAEVRRRRAAMPEKLKLLGFESTPRSLRILDLCCGHGEALDALYEMGFRDLHGGDISPAPRLLEDQRFKVCLCDAANPPFEDAGYDWIVIIHALHHLGTPENIQQVFAQCERLLKPGGRLSLIDFPNSLQIRLAFWFFRQNKFLWTPYLKNFGNLIAEEWPFLQHYLPRFPKVRALMLNGPFEVESRVDRFFYFYWTLRKPESADVRQA